MKWIDGTDLVQWADRRDSQALLPGLVRQLVYATVADARRVEFRAGEGVQLPGWDGYIEAPTGNPFVPEGISCWELGTGGDIAGKADRDYERRTADPLGVPMDVATFAFVTPRRWAGKAIWVHAKQAGGLWRDVRAYDADDLEMWLANAPSVAAWLARRIEKYPANVTSIDDVWNEYVSMTNPQLNSGLLLAGRGAEQERVSAWMSGLPDVLHITADTTAEAVGFVAAHVMALSEDDRNRLRARALATSNSEALRELSVTRAPLLIFYDGENTAPVSVVVQRGHHVLIPLSPGLVTSGHHVVLPRASRESFAAALKSLGLHEEEAFALARDTGRSISAFQRRFAVACPAGPAWARPPHVHDVIALLFAGSWDEQSPVDRDILEELTGKLFHQVAQIATNWAQAVDPPIRQAGSIYAFAAVRDAWQQLSPYLTREALARFEKVAKRVLSQDDPRLTLTPDERWLSVIRGQEQAPSAAIREGISGTLVILSLLGADGIFRHRTHDTVSTVVSSVLAPDVTWQRWYSVADVVTLLAEAAPSEFLLGLQAQLAPAAPGLVQLFDEEGGGFSSRSMHTHLLWALEILAWNPDYLSAVTLVLGHLARIDPGGRLRNRPINSLRDIFLFWQPQTSATLAQRKQALELLIGREPDVAWDLLSKLLPRASEHVMPTARPKWRVVPARPPMTYGEQDQGLTYILEHALALAGTDATRLTLLVTTCGAWPPVLRDQLAANIQVFAENVAGSDDRAMVWAALRHFINNNRSHPNADWAIPLNALNPIVAARDVLVPADRIARSAWLFDDWWPNLGHPRGDDHAATDAAITQARQDALAGIFQAHGREGILAMARAVKYPGFVARETADITGGMLEHPAWLEATLGSTDPSIRLFGQALVTRWRERMGEEWVAATFSAPLTDDTVKTAAFLLGLPFDRSTWGRVESAASTVGDVYWRDVQVWLPKGASLDDLTFAVDKLLAHDRAFAALHLLELHIEVAPGALVLRILQALRDRLINEELPPPNHQFGFALEQLFSRLSATQVDEAEIARLEWFFLPLLSRAQPASTLSLHRQLARDPALFADAVCAIYRARNRNADEEPAPTDHESNLARVAFELLSSWRVVPGTTGNGNLDSATLDGWVDGARKRCIERDREEAGDQHVGQILAHSPAGKDGYWPHSVVRELIERLASTSVESGIMAGLFNKRGVVTRALDDGGQQERVIAVRYRELAGSLAVSHPRTSALLHQLSEAYERYAQREDDRALQRDLH